MEKTLSENASGLNNLESIEAYSACSLDSKGACWHGHQLLELTEANAQLNQQFLIRLQQIERYDEERARMKADIQHYHAKVVQISANCEYEQQQKEAFMCEAREIFEHKEAVFKAEYERQIASYRSTISLLQVQLDVARSDSERLLLQIDEDQRTRTREFHDTKHFNEEQQEIIFHLKEELSALRNELQCQINLSEQQAHDYEAQLRDTNAIILTKANHIQDAELDCQKLTQLCNEKETALRNLQDSYFSKSQALSNAKEKAISDMRTIEESENKRKQAIVSIELLQTELETKRSEEQFMKARIIELESNTAAKSTRIEELERNIKSANAEKLSLIDEYERSLRTVTNDKQSNVEEFTSVSNEMHGKIEDLKRKLTKSTEALQEKQARIEELTRVAANEKQSNYAKSEETNRLNERIDALNRKLKQVLRELESAENRLLQLEQEKGHQDSLLADRETQIMTLRSTIDSIRSQAALEISKAVHQATQVVSRPVILQHANQSPSSPHQQSHSINTAAIMRINSSPLRYVPHHHHHAVPYSPIAVGNSPLSQRHYQNTNNRSIDMLNENDCLNKKILNRCMQIAKNH